MRRQLLRTVTLLTVLTSGAVLGVSVFFAERGVETLSRSLVVQTTQRTQFALERFFGPLEQQLQTMRMWGEAGMLPIEDSDALLQLVHPFLSSHPEVTGLILARGDGAEIFVLPQEQSYKVRILGPAGDDAKRTAVFRRYHAKELEDEWSEGVHYSPTARPWYQGAIALEDPRSTFWTEPYEFFTAQLPGITAATRFERDGRVWVVGLDVALLSISQFTTGLRVSQNGTVAVLTSSGNAIGLPSDPRFEDPQVMRQSMLKPIESVGIAFVAAAVEAGRNLVGGERSSYRYRSGGQRWWGGIRSFQLANGKPLLIQAAVPESDLLGEVRAERNAILLVITLGLAGALVIAYLIGQRYEDRLTAAVTRAEKLGQYTLEEQIGEGGMGAVYRARHAFLRRPTAIKLLRPDSDDPNAFERFEREVQLTAQLTHPNTIAVYDYGRTSGGTFYYAMEYLEGMSLRELVRQHGKLSSPRAIYILRQIAGSLDEAHAAGLVHRDVTPANIFITRRGGQADYVKVLDFGLVERTDEERGEPSEGANTIIGTPSYMAPELIREPTHVGPNIDIYAFGCVAYYMLTGRNVFGGGDAYAIFKQHLNTEPVPPSVGSDAEIEPELENVVMRCLAKAPSGRPSSLGVIKRTLDSIQLDEPWTDGDAIAWWEVNFQREHRPVTSLARPVVETMAVDLSGREAPTVSLEGKGMTQLLSTTTQ